MIKDKILVLSPAPINTCPSQRLKYEQYFAYLGENGFQVRISSFYTYNAWKIIHKRGHIIEKLFWIIWGYFRRVMDLLRVPFYSGIYIHLWVTPLGFPFFEILTLCLNRRCIYDIDDMIFLKEQSKFNQVWSLFKGRGKPFVLMRRASHVIVCTPKLEEVARKYNNNVTDISSTINLMTYKMAKDYKDSGKTVIGWTGSFSGLKYLHTLDDVLRKVAKIRPISVRVIFNMIDGGFELDGVEVENVNWQSSSEVEDISAIGIGLYPLIKDEWGLGKSGLKALQYMALGIPVVATAYGANLRVIENGVSGFLVENEQEWVDTIVKLIDDPGLRREIGLAARLRVEKYFSVEANKGTYLRVFNDVYRKNK